MITLKGVTKSYTGQEKVLDGVDLQLPKGQFLYVLGGSGAGKSTLLRMMATEEAPSQGTVSLFGYDLSRVSPSTLRAIRLAIGYVPQNIRLIPDLTVEENVGVALAFMGRRGATAEARARVDDLLGRLGLGSKRHRPASSLSGGEAQRVAVARALVRSPELVIADEPTGAQDQNHIWKLMELFVHSQAGGKSVIVATHDREIVRRVRKPCAVMGGGRIQVEGRPAGGVPCSF